MKNSLIELIKKRREETELKIRNVFQNMFQCSGYDRNQFDEKINYIKSHTTKTLLQLFEAERGRLEGEKKNKRKELGYSDDDIRESGFLYGYNSAIQSQITHLSEVIEYLKL